MKILDLLAFDSKTQELGLMQFQSWRITPVQAIRRLLIRPRHLTSIIGLSTEDRRVAVGCLTPVFAQNRWRSASTLLPGTQIPVLERSTNGVPFFRDFVVITNDLDVKGSSWWRFTSSHSEKDVECYTPEVSTSGLGYFHNGVCFGMNETCR